MSQEDFKIRLKAPPLEGAPTAFKHTDSRSYTPKSRSKAAEPFTPPMPGNMEEAQCLGGVGKKYDTEPKNARRRVITPPLDDHSDFVSPVHFSATPRGSNDVYDTYLPPSLTDNSSSPPPSFANEDTELRLPRMGRNDALCNWPNALGWANTWQGVGDRAKDGRVRNGRQSAAALVRSCKTELEINEAQLRSRVFKELPRRAHQLNQDIPLSAVELVERSTCKFEGCAEGKIATARMMSAEVWRLQRRITPGSTILDLSECLIGMRQLQAFCMVLVANKQVKSLVLQNNKLNIKHSPKLLSALRAAPQITYLDLSHNQMKDVQWLGELMRPTAVLEWPPMLNELKLSSNNLGDSGGRHVAGFLLRNNILKKLYVSKCQIGEMAAVAIGNAIGANVCLEDLDLSWNIFYTRGAKAIAEGLHGNVNLKRLNLEKNGIGDEGGCAMADMLQENEGLEVLNMAHNRLATKTCTLLSDALPRNKNLRELDLRHNPLGMIGAKGLVMRLSEFNITSVNMQGCTFMKEANTDVMEFNFRNPDGNYNLDLSNPTHRVTVGYLVKLWHAQGQDSWRRAMLDGVHINYYPDMAWPERLPLEGNFVVDFVTTERVPSSVAPFTDHEFRMLWSDMNKTRVLDEWLLEYVRLMAAWGYFKSQQAATILSAFAWQGLMKMEAAVLLFGRMVDPHNVELVLEQFDENGRDQVSRRIGMASMFHPKNATGHYKLDLSKQVDYSIAWRLLHLFEVDLTYNPNAESLRNTFISGKPVEIKTPHDWEPPDKGIMETDYVTSVPASTGNTTAFYDQYFVNFMEQMLSDNELEVKKLATKFYYKNCQQSMVSRLKGLSILGQTSTEVQKEEKAKDKKVQIDEESKRDGQRDKTDAQGHDKESMWKKHGTKTIIATEKPPEIPDTSYQQLVEELPDPSIIHPEGYLLDMLGSPRPEDSSPRERLAGMLLSSDVFSKPELIRVVERLLRRAEKARQLQNSQPTAFELQTQCEERMELLFSISVSHTFTWAQLECILLIQHFWKGDVQQRIVDLLVMFWGRCQHKKHYSRLMLRRLDFSKHAEVGERLGWKSLVNWFYPSMHYKLRFWVPEEYDILKRCCHLATMDPTHSNFQRLHVDGEPKEIKEDNQMFTVLSRHGRNDATVEFDFHVSLTMRQVVSTILIQKQWRKFSHEKWLVRARKAARMFMKRVYALRTRKVTKHLLNEIRQEELALQAAMEKAAAEAEEEADAADQAPSPSDDKSSKLQKKPSRKSGH